MTSQLKQYVEFKVEHSFAFHIMTSLFLMIRDVKSTNKDGTDFGCKYFPCIFSSLSALVNVELFSFSFFIFLCSLMLLICQQQHNFFPALVSFFTFVSISFNFSKPSEKKPHLLTVVLHFNVICTILDSCSFAHFNCNKKYSGFQTKLTLNYKSMFWLNNHLERFFCEDEQWDRCTVNLISNRLPSYKRK